MYSITRHKTESYTFLHFALHANINKPAISRTFEGGGEGEENAALDWILLYSRCPQHVNTHVQP